MAQQGIYYDHKPPNNANQGDHCGHVPASVAVS